MPKMKEIGYVFLEDIHTPTDITVVTDKSNRVIAEGCLQEGEEENRNGRCYLTEDLTREQNCKRTRELLACGYMRGESGHPTDTSIIRQQTIDPSNVCVQYLKYWMDGPKWMAQFKGTNNDLGAAIDADLREGCKPAFSMRALGTLENINGRNVVRDLRYITHDMVIYPSHPGAYTTRVVSESASLYVPNTNFGRLMKKKNKKISVNESVITVTNESVMSYIREQSQDVKSVLEQVEVFYESAVYQPERNRVILKAKTGDTFVVNCESYIKNEIENYCDSFFDNRNL